MTELDNNNIVIQEMIFHTIVKKDWDVAVKSNSCGNPSLDTEGFIHCSTIDQLSKTTNKFFSGRKDIVILCIDEKLLTAEVKFENSSGLLQQNKLYPHIYGKINIDAVKNVVRLVANSHGIFELPAELLIYQTGDQQ